MSAFSEYIKDVLEKNGVVHVPNTLPNLTMSKLKESSYYPFVKECYEDLGGTKADVPFALNHWLIELRQKVVVLDDSIHFNRYRTITLRSDFYEEHLGFDIQAYRRHCRQEEKNCLAAASHGHLWQSKPSERHFGTSNSSGDLGLNGSSQWKMQAFVDFLSDVSGKIMGYEVIRISIYDTVMVNGQLTSLKQLLLSRQPKNEHYLFNFLSRKLGLVKKDISQFMKEELKKMDDE